MIDHPQVRVICADELPTVKKWLADIGVDQGGMERLEPKSIHRLVLVRGLSVEQAHLLKHEFLSVGADAAISRDAYVFTSQKTDALCMGTLKQYGLACAKMANIPHGLTVVAEEIRNVIVNQESEPNYLYVGSKRFDLRERTLVAGILNITPDSFSDGGVFFDQDEALSHAIMLADQGADIIDVGGESSRPGAEPVSLEEELNRVIPVVEKITGVLEVPVSIDTYKAEVASEAIKAGAAMINDISGLSFDSAMVEVVAKSKAALVIMHMQGEPRNMQENPKYDSVVGDISGFLRRQIQKAVTAGVLKSQILVDPGIGFGKNLEHNLEILNRLKEFKCLGCPLYIGPSKKSFIGKITGAPAGERQFGTAAAVTASILNGASVVRVHDVAEMKETIKIADAIIREKA